MKKFLFAIVSILAVICSFNMGSFNYVFATEQTTGKDILLPHNYTSVDYVTKYNISADERAFYNTPFIKETKETLPGAGITPLHEDDNSFSREYYTDSVSIDDTKSLYIYIFFSEIDVYDLTMTLSDQTNTLSWEINGNTIAENLVESTSSSYSKYGWMLLELPVLAGTKVGELSSVDRLIINYDQLDKDNDVTYAKLSIYEPYISESSNQKVSFINKINFFNFNFEFGDNLDSYCIGDSYTVKTLNNSLEYCVLGDNDVLNSGSTDNYKFTLDISCGQNSSNQKFTLSATQTQSYTFSEQGLYHLTFTIEKLNESDLYDPIAKQYAEVTVSKFFAVYLPTSIPDTIQNKTITLNINQGSLATNIGEVTALSSDTDIAEVYVQDDQLIIKTKKAGVAKITLSVDATRDHAETKTYTYEYTITVKEPVKSTNWIGLIIGAIGLIIGAIVLYTIMVNKRLIKNKYPKY